MTRRPRLVSSLPEHQSISVQLPRSCDQEFVAEPVVHDHAGIAVYLAGSSRFWMGRDYRVRRGDLLVVPEGMPHFSHEMEEVEMIGVALCTACMRGTGWGEAIGRVFASVQAGESAVRRADDHERQRLVAVMEAVHRELDRPSRHADLMIDGLMSQFAAHVGRASPVGSDAPAESKSVVVMNALEVVQRRAREVSLSDVAHEVGRSSAHLAALVKEETGRTVVEWITSARMSLARQLLLSSDDTIAAIADAVGYASSSHFHRTFRREHGVAPGAWRDAHRRL